LKAVWHGKIGPNQSAHLDEGALKQLSLIKKIGFSISLFDFEEEKKIKFREMNLNN